MCIDNKVKTTAKEDNEENSSDGKTMMEPEDAIQACITLDHDEDDLEWPEDASKWGNSSNGCVLLFRKMSQKLFYSYMNEVLRKGAILHSQRRKAKINERRNDVTVGELCKDDIYKAPVRMTSQQLQGEFRRLWQLEQTKKMQNNDNDDSLQSARSSFLNILWGLAKPTYIPAAFCQLIQVTAQISAPLLLRGFLIQLEQNPDAQFLETGLPLAFGFFFVSLIAGIAMERQKYLSFQTGIVLKSAIVNAVYDHVLGLTPSGKAGLTTGEATNLVAVDAQKLFELTQEGHQAWACPLSMVVVTILLLVEMGPSVLVGMATMFLQVPLGRRIVTGMMSVRKQRVIQSDRRIETTTAMLQGIKFTKLNHYEGKFLQRINEARGKEMKFLRKELAMLGITLFLIVISPVTASSVTYITYVFIHEDHILTASTTFTTLFLFAALRFPINYVGQLMGKAAQGLQACERLAEFFLRESTPPSDETSKVSNNTTGDETVEEEDNNTDEAILTVKNGTFSVESFTTSDGADVASTDLQDSVDDSDNNPPPTSSSFTVSNVDITLKRSEILCVVGPVGCGKTTLCQGLIGDIPMAPCTKMTIKGSSRRNNNNNNKSKVAYASQIPFILNASIRENILFGEEFDEDRYNRVLEACCLIQDLEQVGPAKDLTEIGERGVTLSGGQKQRVSLARVAYSQPDVAIFDDPLSALDASTGNAVFEKLFQGGKVNATTYTKNKPSLLHNTAVVLVTHAAHFLHRVDQILILAKGQPAFMGSWDDLAAFRLDSITDRDVAESILSIQDAVQEDQIKIDEGEIDESESNSTNNDATTKSTDRNDISLVKGGKDIMKGDGDLMTVEEREFGLSDFRTWLKWFKYAGGFFFVVVAILALFVDRFAYVLTELWLALWTSAAETDQPVCWWRFEFPPQSEVGAQKKYVSTYCIILIVSFIGAFLRTQWLVQAGARCSGRMFTLMTERVLCAPISYFETTPMGRILNRFTYDVETLDVTLTNAMNMLLTAFGWFFAGIILQAIILPWQLMAVVFIMTIYWVVLLHYRKSAVDLQRLDAMSRSPVQAQLSEVLEGATTIRVFKKVPFFSNIFRSALDDNTSCMMNFMAAHRWLTVRSQVLASFAVLFSVCFVVAYNEVLQLPAGIAGILVIWSSNFTITLGFMIQGISESEAALTSVERVAAMTELPQESTDQSGDELTKDWPSNGSLVFEDVKLRYRPGLPLSLDGLSFSLKSGQRCGVVGRTGAGKSTLTVALFRLVDVEHGRITLDGVDLSKLGLADVRGRKNGMYIIPQDPVLFAGSLRDSLDPFGECTDEQVLDALKAVRVANASERGLIALRDYVDEGGRNYSVGERQLLCLARAILSQPKLLVLDEATASVDSETDAFIQKMLRSRFEGTTLLTIAHRLNTIMDYDVILAMENGKAAEFGSPKELLEKENGLFRSLVDATGKESAAALESMVPPKKEKRKSLRRLSWMHDSHKFMHDSFSSHSYGGGW